mmetsp:Transcript_24431/g.96962  ORF Transcript_24431/g.96962 Transcript_24431/m.96962 type:complete len:119 (+) Transcript_24431:3214-3570(+)
MLAELVDPSRGHQEGPVGLGPHTSSSSADFKKMMITHRWQHCEPKRPQHLQRHCPQPPISGPRTAAATHTRTRVICRTEARKLALDRSKKLCTHKHGTKQLRLCPNDNKPKQQKNDAT